MDSHMPGDGDDATQPEAGTAFPEQRLGGEHYRPDGSECAYLAQAACSKCGGVAPFPARWADHMQAEAVPHPGLEFRQVSDGDQAVSGEKAV